MRPFEYFRPSSLADAAQLGAVSGAKYIAGGTNLVDLMKLGVEQPDRVVDLRDVLEQEIQELEDGSIRIGAGVRNTDLASHPLIRRQYPAMSRAIVAGASGQIRNVATTGGNLLQRTRCVYFQDVSRPCNKRAPGTGCPALESGGLSRGLAIFRTSEECIATHPSDLAVALVAFDAELALWRDGQERRLPLEQLYTSQESAPGRETILEPGEIITAVHLPAPVDGRRSHYVKVRDRASFAFSLVSVAAAVELDGDTVRGVRIALGGVASRPWRARSAEQAIQGAPATSANFSRAIRDELTTAVPTADNRFKLALAHNLVVSTLEELI